MSTRASKCKQEHVDIYAYDDTKNSIPAIISLFFINTATTIRR